MVFSFCAAVSADEEEVLWCEETPEELGATAPVPPCWGDIGCCYEMAYNDEAMAGCLVWVVSSYIPEVCMNMLPNICLDAVFMANCAQGDFQCITDNYFGCMDGEGYANCIYVLRYQVVDICISHMNAWYYACVNGAQ
jgi:hypothetical protein